MKKRKICSVLIAGILSVGMILTGCGAGQPGGQSQKKVTEAEKKLKVVTTIFPQYDFVRQIAGDQVELQMLLKPGEETHCKCGKDRGSAGRSTGGTGSEKCSSL